MSYLVENLVQGVVVVVLVLALHAVALRHVFLIYIHTLTIVHTYLHRAHVYTPTHIQMPCMYTHALVYTYTSHRIRLHIYIDTYIPKYLHPYTYKYACMTFVHTGSCSLMHSKWRGQADAVLNE